jgi:APA family basic amino acid/polyamine antiporter
MSEHHMPAKQNEHPQLLRALGLREGVAIFIGDVIGSGIFIVPATIAGHLHAMGPIMVVWVLAGLLTFFGALTLAELSAVFPQAGGPYVYLRHSFGKLWGFLFSWNDYFINKAGSAAAISMAFATFLGDFAPQFHPSQTFFRYDVALFHLGFSVSFGWIQLVAVATIAIVTFVNVRGVRWGGWVMDIFTGAKIVALVGLIFAAFASAGGSAQNYLPWWPDHWSGSTTAAFGLAMISALWAYDGWMDVTLAAGEIKNAKRNVPLSLLIGSLTVVALYIAANLAYAYLIPLSAMQHSPRIAADVAHKAFGPLGASLVVIGILCSTFGSTNGMLLSGPRSIYASGAGGTFSKRFGNVHPKYHTPSHAILTLGIWSAILTVSGTYEQITSFVVFGAWGFYALTAFSVIVLRRKMPDADRPYKAWGYPYATLLFIAIAGWFIYNTLVEDTRNAVIGIALLLLSLPFYYYWTRKRPA